MEPWPSGKAEVCKTSIPGSNPGGSSKILSILIALGTLGGCSDDSIPTTEELYGTWTNLTEGQHRAFVFAATSSERSELMGVSPTFLFYSYPMGQAPVLVQAGSYEVDQVPLNEGGEPVTDDALVVSVLWDAAGTTTGMMFGNGIEQWDGDSFVLRGTTEREFTSATALP